MIDLVDRIVDSTLPPLPPFLLKKKPERKRIVLPDIRYGEYTRKTKHDNTWTIHYFHMCRLELESGYMEFATTNCRKYRQWLKTEECKDGIPPHIQFGGAVIAGESDPEFYKRWVEYAIERFV